MTAKTPSTLPAEFKEVASLCAATEVVVGGRTVIGIADHRMLHAGLHVGRDHTNWIKGRIAKYGFRAGVDYEVFAETGENPEGGRPASIYRLTLGAAKELAMVENNDHGRLIRRYYLWLEDVAQHGDDGLLRRVDGISRMLAHKITVLEKMLASQEQRLSDLLMIGDGRAAVKEMVSVRELLDQAKAVPKGRRSISGKVRNALQDRALQQGVSLRRCLHSNVWLFPVDFAGAFMAEIGIAWVREHNSIASGQGVLQLVPKETPTSP